MPNSKKVPEKWGVRVYRQGEPRFAPGLDSRGRKSTRDTAVWRRDYLTKTSLNRALPYLVRTYPDHDIQVTHYKLQYDLFWMGQFPTYVGKDYQP